MNKDNKQYPHPLQYQCPDCKGSGVYKGLNITLENCKTCDGHGSLIGVQLKGTMKQDWDQLVDAVKKNSDPKPVGDQDTALSFGHCTLGGPFEGEVVYVFDAGWYEAKIKSIYDGGVRGTRMVRADYTSGTFRIPLNDICWNLTEKRWEHIRGGTPVWP